MRAGQPVDVASHAIRVLAPNASEMTLNGTNSYVLHTGTDAVLVDPGPLDEAHLALLVETAASRGLTVRASVLTHHHHDHAESRHRIAELTAAPVLDHTDLPDGAEIPLPGGAARVVHTPGHTIDSLSVLLPEDRVLLTGDHILGTGTTVVLHPGGDLESYLRSLELTHQLAHDGEVTRFLPGHGPIVEDPVGWVEYYQSHRFDRLADVRAQLAAGLTDPDEIAAALYPTLTGLRGWAASRIVRAQLAYVAAHPDPADDEELIPFHGHCADPAHRHVATSARAARSVDPEQDRAGAGPRGADG